MRHLGSGGEGDGNKTITHMTKYFANDIMIASSKRSDKYQPYFGTTRARYKGAVGLPFRVN